MRFPFRSSLSRLWALLGLLALAVMQGGCAHPVVMGPGPSVSVHSRIGHAPVDGHVGVPGLVYAAPPRVMYAPPPPQRIVVLPQAHPPAQIWRHGHERGQRGQARRQYHEDEGSRGGWRGRRDSGP